jgi:hypothetical protein
MGSTVMASAVRGKWRRRSREEWRAVFERFAASGQSIRQFCEREELSKSSFERWRGLLAGETPVAADRDEAGAGTGFVDTGLIGVGVGGGAGRLELTLDLGGGVVLHLVRG